MVLSMQLKFFHEPHFLWLIIELIKYGKLIPNLTECLVLISIAKNFRSGYILTTGSFHSVKWMNEHDINVMK